MTPPATTWKLTLSYDGTLFHGWQVQPGHSTIQGALSDALAHIAGERVLPQGSGRTDAGVHALGQVASFALAAPIPAANLLRALNRALPSSIRVLSAEPAPPTFHARHSALRKTYEYRIFGPRLRPTCGSERSLDWELATGRLATETQLQQPASSRQRIENADLAATEPGAPFMRRSLSHGWGEDAESTSERICPPFLAPFVWDCRWSLQLEPMQRAAAHLLGSHDFTSFAATDPDLAERISRTTPCETPPRSECAAQTQMPSSRPEWDGPIVPHSGETPVFCDARATNSFSTPNPIKTIFTSTISRENNLLLYRVTGSGFLHHMVRNLVGTLLEIGRGRLTPDAIPHILAARSRSAAGPTAPARGLFLVSVDYPPQPATTIPPETRP